MEMKYAVRVRERDWFPFPFSIFKFQLSQDVATQVLILDDFGELFMDIRGIYFDIFLFQIRRLEGKLVENFFENGVQTSSADIFRLLVDTGSEFSDGVDSVLSNVELDAFGLEQRDILFDERVFRLG